MAARRRRLVVLLLCWLVLLPCTASIAHRCAPPARLRHGQPIAQDLRPANPSNFLKLAKKGDSDALAACLESGIDLNAGRQGSFALHIASGLGHTKVVQLLLGAGVQPTTVEKGVTALHSAAFKCHAEVVDLLLAAGARPDAKDADGSTPLRFALAQSAHARVAHALLRAGTPFEETEL